MGYRTGKLVIASVISLGALGATGVANAFEDPALVKAVAPEYPRAAERKEIEGYVRIKFVINDKGKVDAVEVVEATPPGVFDSAATKAASKWVFEAGKPTDGMIKKVTFKLVDG